MFVGCNDLSITPSWHGSLQHKQRNLLTRNKGKNHTDNLWVQLFLVLTF